MSDGYMAVYGDCFACHQPFMFDPDTVPSVPIDPVTGTTPELGGDPARAVRQPVCPMCIDRANIERARRGLPPHRTGR